MKNESLERLLDLYVNHTDTSLVIFWPDPRYDELRREELVKRLRDTRFSFKTTVTITISGAALAQAMLDAAKPPEVIPA